MLIHSRTPRTGRPQSRQPGTTPQFPNLEYETLHIAKHEYNAQCLESHEAVQYRPYKSDLYKGESSQRPAAGKNTEFPLDFETNICPTTPVPLQSSVHVWVVFENNSSNSAFVGILHFPPIQECAASCSSVRSVEIEAAEPNLYSDELKDRSTSST